MNQEIISRKLLLLSSLISIMILLFYTVIHTLSNRFIVAFCNIENKVNILLRIDNNDILVNPIGTKETLECLGKHMPFYDRTIETIITDKNTNVYLIKERYNVGQILTDQKVKILNILIMNNEYLEFQYNTNRVIIVQRPLKTISEILLRNNSPVIRPISEDIIEQILNTMIKQQTVIKNGEVGQFSIPL